MPQDIKKCQTYAGKKICFEQEEVAEIKHFDKPGQVLIHEPYHHSVYDVWFLIFTIILILFY